MTDWWFYFFFKTLLQLAAQTDHMVLHSHTTTGNPNTNVLLDRRTWTRISDSPPGARGCKVGWSCPSGACSPRGSPSPAPTAAWADPCRCLCRKHPCPRSSARSHTLPLEHIHTHIINKFHNFCSQRHSQEFFNSTWLDFSEMQTPVLGFCGEPLRQLPPHPPQTIKGQVKEPFQVRD